MKSSRGKDLLAPRSTLSCAKPLETREELVTESGNRHRKRENRRTNVPETK